MHVNTAPVRPPGAVPRAQTQPVTTKHKKAPKEIKGKKTDKVLQSLHVILPLLRLLAEMEIVALHAFENLWPALVYTEKIYKGIEYCNYMDRAAMYDLCMLYLPARYK